MGEDVKNITSTNKIASIQYSINQVQIDEYQNELELIEPLIKSDNFYIREWAKTVSKNIEEDAQQRVSNKIAENEVRFS